MASYKVEIFSSDSLNNVISIPAGTSFVKFTADSLDKIPASELKAFFSRIPPSVTIVSLANCLGKISIDTLMEACSGFPETVKWVDLSFNDLGTQNALELANFISVFANQFSIDWAHNNFDKKTSAELKLILSSSSAKTTLVDLSAMRLFSRNSEEVREIFSGIKIPVNSLDLSDNALYKIIPELQQSFPSITAKLRSLNLCFNELDKCSGSELKAFFSLLPSTLITADLSYNNLGNKRGFELKKGFSGFQPELSSVKLSRNGFPEKNFAELEEAFSGFPPTLISVDFSDDKSIKQLNNEQLIAFLQTIPMTVKLIDLSHNKLFKGKTAKERDELLQALKRIDPDGIRFNLAHNGQSIAAVPAARITELAGQQPREKLNSILHLVPKPEHVAAEKMVSKFSFFSPLSLVQELKSEPVHDHVNKP